jgi:AcrR family transcriptional regulator
VTPDRLTDDQRALVTDRILDAAKRCFASRGVEHTDMHHIAVEASVSYETLHQYFPDRDALQAAYSHRQALEVAAEAFSTIHPNDPLDRQLVEVVIAVLRAVRSDPVLAERFGSDNVGAAVAFAHRSEVVRGIAETFFVELSRDAQEAAAAWVLRVVVAFLIMPAVDERYERLLLERFMAPAFAGTRRLTWR